MQKAFVDRQGYATWTNWCSFFPLFWFQCDFSKRSCGWVLVWPQTEGHHTFASKSAISALRAWKVSVRHSTSRFCKTVYGRLLRDICFILICLFHKVTRYLDLCCAYFCKANFRPSEMCIRRSYYILASSVTLGLFRVSPSYNRIDTSIVFCWHLQVYISDDSPSESHKRIPCVDSSLLQSSKLLSGTGQFSACSALSRLPVGATTEIHTVRYWQFACSWNFFAMPSGKS